MIEEEFDPCLQRNSNEKKQKKLENQSPIDTSTAKLEGKYKWLKDQCHKTTNRAKTGSGKAAKKDPEWYIILDLVFTETYTNLNLAS